MPENEILEISIYGRGGEGIVSASNLLAKTVLLEHLANLKKINQKFNPTRFHCQSVPEFGPERRGAPVKAFVRIDDKNYYFWKLGPVKRPDHLIVFNEGIVENSVLPDFENNKKQGSVFINYASKDSFENFIELKFNKKTMQNKEFCCFPANELKNRFNVSGINVVMLAGFLKFVDIAEKEYFKKAVIESGFEKNNLEMIDFVFSLPLIQIKERIFAFI
jgi:pyruvate ferredoxin oxidoreductase gamma subunit